MSNYTNYSPINIVKSIHNIPHLDKSLKLTNSNFDITNNDPWDDYTKSLLPFPIIISLISVIILLILIIISTIFLCRRNRKKSFNLRDESSNVSIDQSPEILPVQSSYNILPIYKLSIAFYFFVILCLIIDNSIFYGNNSFINATNGLNEGLDFVYDVSYGLDIDGIHLSTDGIVLTQQINEASTTCPQSDEILPYLTDYALYVNEYNDIVSPLPDRISSAQNDLNNFGVTYKNDTIWVFYSVITSCIVIYFLGYIFKFKRILQCGLLCNDFIILLLFILSAVILILLMGFADYCVDPYSNLLILVPSGTNNEMAAYYSTCTGDNPITAPLSSANQAINDLNSTVNFLLTICPDNIYLSDALTTINYMYTNLTDINSLSSCPPIQTELSSVLTNDLCTDGFTGLFVVWLWIYLSGVLLLILTTVIVIIYIYYGQHWNMDEENSQNNAIIYYNEEDTNNEFVNPIPNESNDHIRTPLNAPISNSNFTPSYIIGSNAIDSTVRTSNNSSNNSANKPKKSRHLFSTQIMPSDEIDKSRQSESF